MGEPIFYAKKLIVAASQVHVLALARQTTLERKGVASGLLVKALDCGSKGLEFQSHLQQRFISLLGALSPTPKIE